MLCESIDSWFLRFRKNSVAAFSEATPTAEVFADDSELFDTLALRSTVKETSNSLKTSIISLKVDFKIARAQCVACLQARVANPLLLLKYLLSCLETVSESRMAYLLVMWEEDNSISVISRKAKALLSVEGTKIKFRWPKKGVYEGTIVDSSGMVKQRSK